MARVWNWIALPWLFTASLVAQATPLQVRLAPQSQPIIYGVNSVNAVDAMGSIGSVQWSLLGDSSLPPDLGMATAANGELILQGDARFEGNWCFSLQAIDVAGNNGADEICLVSTIDPSRPAPAFLTGRQLNTDVVGQPYLQILAVDPSTLVPGMDYDLQIVSALPPGIVAEVQKAQNRIVLRGTPVQRGTYYVVARVEQNGVQLSKQFSLYVAQQVISAPVCAPGYQYNAGLGYCVQIGGVSCGLGTYYDPNLNSCVAYPRGPIFCAGDEYYDFYLGVCVFQTYPRCPSDMRWDPFDYRCEWDRISNPRPRPPGPPSGGWNPPPRPPGNGGGWNPHPNPPPRHPPGGGIGNPPPRPPAPPSPPPRPNPPPPPPGGGNGGGWHPPSPPGGGGGGNGGWHPPSNPPPPPPGNGGGGGGGRGGKGGWNPPGNGGRGGRPFPPPGGPHHN
jgi:hypothetical protein